MECPFVLNSKCASVIFGTVAFETPGFAILPLFHQLVLLVTVAP